MWSQDMFCCLLFLTFYNNQHIWVLVLGWSLCNARLYLQRICTSAWVGPSFPNSRKGCEHFICVAGQGSSLIICIGILKGYSESLFKMISNLQRMWYFGGPTTLVLLWFHEWQHMHSLVFVHGWSQIEFSWVCKLLFSEYYFDTAF